MFQNLEQLNWWHFDEIVLLEKKGWPDISQSTAYFNALNNTTFEFILLILKFLSYNSEFGPLMAISYVPSLNLKVLSTAQDQLKLKF